MATKKRVYLTVESRRGSGDAWRVWGCYTGRGCWSAARQAEREALDCTPAPEVRIVREVLSDE